MAQVITNTFFDDCEAIVNENGVPTLDFTLFARELIARFRPSGFTEANGGYCAKSLAVACGLSERFLDGLPYTALGLCIKRNDARNNDTVYGAVVNAFSADVAVAMSTNIIVPFEFHLSCSSNEFSFEFSNPF